MQMNTKQFFEKYSLKNIFLITPQTSVERIHFIDSVSDGFIYMVSSAVLQDHKPVLRTRRLFQTY
jgi:tryptophan synthase alpha subunit